MITTDPNRLSAQLYIRSSLNNRQRHKNWYGPNGPDYAREYATCLPATHEADLYVFDQECQRLRYTETIKGEDN